MDGRQGVEWAGDRDRAGDRAGRHRTHAVAVDQQERVEDVKMLHHPRRPALHNLEATGDTVDEPVCEVQPHQRTGHDGST